MSEDLKDISSALEQSMSDTKALWETTATLVDARSHNQISSRGVTTTLTLNRQCGHVSALLDSAVGHNPSVTHLRSAFRIALEKLGLTMVDKGCQQEYAMDTVGDRNCGLSQYIAEAIQVCESLRRLPEWHIQFVHETSSLVDLVVKSTWISLLEALLGSLRQILQHLLELGCSSAFCAIRDQLTKLQEAFDGYSGCQTRSQIERLVASRRSTMVSLKKLHKSAAHAIQSLGGYSKQLIETTTKSAHDEQNAHQGTEGFPTPDLEPSITSRGLSFRSFTIRITKDGHDQPLDQSSLDGFLTRTLL